MQYLVLHRSDSEFSDDEESLPKTTATVVPLLTTTPILVASPPTRLTAISIPSIQPTIEERLTYLKDSQVRVDGLLRQILVQWRLRH